MVYVEDKLPLFEDNIIYTNDSKLLILLLNKILDSDDICYECQKSNDLEYLLICDLCKMNVCHTYCCGLEKNIPEGSWFCKNCKLFNV